MILFQRVPTTARSVLNRCAHACSGFRRYIYLTQLCEPDPDLACISHMLMLLRLSVMITMVLVGD